MSLRKLWEIVDREGWKAVVHGITKSQTRLSDLAATTEDPFRFNLGHRVLILNSEKPWVSWSNYPHPQTT